MTEQEIAAAAEILAQARQSGMQINGLPVTPSSVAQAHEIQDRVAVLVGEPIGAFKAGAPPEGEPTRGLIETRMIRSSPAHMAVAEVPHLGVEGEVAFRFIRDLPARSEPYTREEVAKAVAVLPVIEVVSSRFHDPLSRPKLEQLADCGINAGLVTGPELADWSHLDLPKLQMTFTVNGETLIERRGGHPTDDPIAGAVALANMMRAGVKAGQIVTTGSWTGLPFFKPGDRCTVRFEGLGEAEVVFDG
ncbi:2-keto-4-pentenoate hydratase [Tardiphaga sp.]|uniref:2-keto-4-pentenoate hydratase n=1 Tax=Tardiphaga sp. TaxID=1926292 RepID=UPI00352A0347